MKILEKFKSLSLIAIASIFFLSASLSSCGDGKKEASSDDDSTEEVMEVEETDEAGKMDSTEHSEEGSEHPSSKEEHPSGGDEHPSN